MPYRFIFRTWLLVILFQILLIYLVFGCYRSAGFIDVELLQMICLFSVPFTIPGLIGLMILVWIAREFIYHPRTQFSFIFFGAAGVTVFCYCLFEFTLNINMKLTGYLPFFGMSLTSVFLALVFTRKYYYRHVNHLR